MPVQVPSNVAHESRGNGAAALCMYVIVSRTPPPAQLAETQDHSLSLTADMMLDLFDARGIRTERLASDLILAYPPDSRSAVDSFYLLSHLLHGFCTEDPANHTEIFALLLTAGQGALVTEPARLKSDLAPFFSNLPHSALITSEEIYRHAKDEPGLTFSKIPAPGPIKGDAFYQLSPLGYGENDALHSQSATSMPHPVIPPRPTPPARPRSIDGLPEHLLLLVQKQPQVWTLSLASTLAVILIGIPLLFIHPSPHPARSHSATPTVMPVPAPEKPAAAPADTPPVASTPATPHPAPLLPSPPAKSKVELKEKDPLEHEPAQAAQKEKPHVDVIFSQQDIQSLLVKADRFSGNGNYDQAIAYYKRVLRQDPQNPEANRGIKRAQQNKAQ